MILDIKGGKGWLRVTCLMADSMSSQENGWDEYNRMFTQLLGSCHWTAKALLAPEDWVERLESIARVNDRLRRFIADQIAGLRILRDRMAEFEAADRLRVDLSPEEALLHRYENGLNRRVLRSLR